MPESTFVDVDYLALEPRRVLSADFALLGGVLDLDNFTQSIDENLSIDQSANFYQFELEEGTWSGVDSALVSGNGTNTLTANANFLSAVSVNDNLGIALDVNFGNADLSQLNSMSIDTLGSIGQSAFSTLVAPTLNLTGNDIDLANTNNNFDAIDIQATTNASIADIDRIEILSADVEDKLDVQAAGIDLVGIVTADRIWFESTQGLTQTGSSSVMVNELLLTGQGNFELNSTLNNPVNDATNTAADIDGNLTIAMLGGINLSNLNCDGTIYCGINITGDLEIASNGGDITQDANAALFVGGDALFSTTQGGEICLSGGDCDGDGTQDNLVVGSVSFSTSGDIVFAENDDVLIGGITAGNNFRFIGNSIVFNSNVTANSLLLQASDGVVSNGNTITAGDLLLTGTGNFEVGSLSNSIQNVAANITGDLWIGSRTDLTISTLMHTSCLGNVEVSGLQVDGNAAIIAGTTGLGKITLDGDALIDGRLLLQANDGVQQISGIVDAEDVILDGTGDFHLCLENSIGTITTAGRLSADVDGDVYVRNRFAIELINQNFATKSETIVDHNQFRVSNNLSVVSDAANSTAIFDSTQINVGGEASFVATGVEGDIVVEELNVAGPIGIASAAGDVRIINQHANGIVFRGDDIPGTTATEFCPHFEQNTINGDLFAQATSDDISNEADTTLEVKGLATLIAGTPQSSNVTGSNNEFNIKLGLATNDDVRIDTLSASADQASLELDGSVVFANTAIGNPTAAGADDGTLFLSVDGSVIQEVGMLLSADNIAITVSDYLLLNSVDADRVAFASGGFVDSSLLTEVPEDLPDNDSDRFAPRHTSVDTEYGIIVSSQNDLTITTISDALGCQQDLTGISADAGHAFVQTMGDGNIHFDGSANANTIAANGTIFGLAADMQNGHVLTTIAAGDLTIGDNTVLRSTSGTVTDISAFTTDEGVDFTNVTKEGPLFRLFLPTPSDDPTTKTVNTDDAQFIGLNFGRAGEQNFTVEVNWADGTLDVLNFDTDIGNRFERISHTFTNQFLLENFELPTFLNFFNDPAINLFDNGGQPDLNGGPNDLNTNDNFVLAFSDSRPQGDLQIGAVSRPEALVRDTIIPVNDEQISSDTEASEFGQTETVIDEEVSDAYLIRLDEAGLELKETRQDLEESTVIQDVIAQWKRRVEDGTQFPPGQYRINWTESGVSFSIEFEKGAEEDLDPDELRTFDELQGNSDSPAGEDLLPPEEPKNVDKTDEIEQTSVPNAPIEPSPGNLGGQTQTALALDHLNRAENEINATLVDDEVEIIVEDVTPPCRASLIAAGAIAIGMKGRRKDRGNKLMEELSMPDAEGEVISFRKSARVSRKIGS